MPLTFRLFVLATLMLTAVATALAAERVDSVPSQFVGTWDPEGCRHEYGDLRIRITPTRVRHWESEGPIVTVALRGEHEIVIVSELSSEGETWLSARRYTLQDDALVDEDTVPGQRLVRRRCAAVTADGALAAAFARLTELERPPSLHGEALRRALQVQPVDADGNVLVLLHDRDRRIDWAVIVTPGGFSEVSKMPFDVAAESQAPADREDKER